MGNIRAKEMAHWLRALAVHVEDQGSIPSTHIAAHNHLCLVPGNPTPSSGFLGHCTYKVNKESKHSYTQYKNKYMGAGEMLSG